MYEKQVRLFKHGNIMRTIIRIIVPWFKGCYLINNNENEAENENRSHRYDINSPSPRHGLKYTKYKMCQSIIVAICIKQHLSNI